MNDSISSSLPLFSIWGWLPAAGLAIATSACSLSAAEVRAHRGNLFGHPEHTLESYRDVIKAGASVVEIDVQHTLDQVPICLHDASLDRTTNRTGIVATLTLAQVQEADAGIMKHASYVGRRIPTLQAALEFIKTQRAKVLIEPKVNATVAIVRAIEASGIQDDRISILLFEPGSKLPTAAREALAEFRALKPNWEYWLVTGGTPLSIGAARLAEDRNAGWDGFSFWSNTFTADDFALAHSQGLKVGVYGSHPYGVDASNVMQYVRDGADLLLSDNPGILANSLMEGYIAASYQEFITRFSVPTGRSGRDDDPDGDGLTNTEEYAYQTDPMTANSIPDQSTPTIAGEDVSSHLILTARLPHQPLKSTWIMVEQSTDLVNWLPADPTWVQEELTHWPADPAFRFRIDFGSPSPPTRAFFRVKPRLFPKP